MYNRNSYLRDDCFASRCIMLCICIYFNVIQYSACIHWYMPSNVLTSIGMVRYPNTTSVVLIGHISIFIYQTARFKIKLYNIITNSHNIYIYIMNIIKISHIYIYIYI